MILYCSGELYDEPIDDETCLACAREKITPPCGFTYPLLKAMLKSTDNEKRRSEVHVTDIVGCLRKAYFDKVEKVPVYVHELLSMFIGRAVHEYIASYNDESEIDLSHGDVIGRADYVGEDYVIDFKTTRSIIPKYLPYGHHGVQISAYASILNKKRGYLNYIDVNGAPTCPECKRTLVFVRGTPTCTLCGFQSPQGHVGSYTIAIDICNICDKIEHRSYLLKQALERGEPPAGEPGFECMFCNDLQCQVRKYSRR